jgi:hypothetical protein
MVDNTRLEVAGDGVAAAMAAQKAERKAKFEAALAEYDRLSEAGQESEAWTHGLELIETYPEYGLGYARLITSTRDPAKVLRIADLAINRVKLKPDPLKIAIRAARRVRGHEAEIPFQRWLASYPGEAVAAQRRVAVLCLLSGDGRGALQALDAAEQAGAPPEELRLDRVKGALMATEPALARKLFAQLPPAQADEVREDLVDLETRARALEARKQSGRIRELATTELKEWAQRRGLDPERRQAGFITEAGDMVGEGVRGSRSVVLIFGGIGSMVGAPLPRFAEMLGSHRINAVYLSDPRRMLLMGGLPSFGDYDQSIAGLQRLFRDWGVERIYCLGSSAGGFSAISYGLDLGARRIMTFAAPTTLAGSVADEDGRARVIMKRIRTATTRELDMRAAIGRAAIGGRQSPPEIINYYGAEMPQDRAHALHLQGLANVSLRPLEGASTHAVVTFMMERGTYEPALAELLADCF